MKIKSFIFLFSLVFFSFWAPSFVNANYMCNLSFPDGSSYSSCSATNNTSSNTSFPVTCEEAECDTSPSLIDSFCLPGSMFTVPFMSMDMYYCNDTTDTPDFNNVKNWSAACKQEAEMFYPNYTSSCERNTMRWPVVAGQTYELTCCFTLNPTLTPTPPPTPTPTPPPPAECQVITSPPSLDLLSGESSVSVADVTGLGSATINQMHFGVYENPPGTIIATVDPISDSNSPYSTRVSLITNGTTWRTGTTAVWATADLSDGRTCQSSGTTDTDIYVPYTILVKVFNDDGDGVQETGEIGTAGATVTLTPGNQYGFTIPTSQTLTGGRSDTAYFWRIPGNYTLTVTVPSGYTIRNSGSQVASIIINNLSQNMTYSFPVVPPPGGNTPTPTPQVCDNFGDTGAYCIADDGGPGTCNDDLNCSPVRYSISGKLFLDNYEDTQSTGDDKYTNSVAVTVKKGEETFAVTPSGGTYTANNLPAGDYTIKFSGLPEGWRFTYPNTPDNSLQVQVGPTCEYPITTSEASCRP